MTNQLTADLEIPDDAVVLAEPPADPSHVPAAAAAAEVLVNRQPVYSGFWVVSTSGQYLRLDRDYDTFLKEYGEMYAKNFKVGSLSSCVVDGRVAYSVTYDPNSAGQYLRLGYDSNAFIAEYDVLWKKGFRLSALDSYVLNGRALHNATWRPSTAGQYLRLDRTYDQFLAEYGEMYGKNFKLAALASYVVGGIVYYSAVYDPASTGQYLRLGRTAAALRTEYTSMLGNGFRLAVVDSYLHNGQTYYNAAYNPGSTGQELRLDLGYQPLLDEYGNQWNRNYRLAGLVVDKFEGLSRRAMADKISAALAPNVVGFAAMVASASGKAGSDEGLRRTASDQPVRFASAWSRTNVASVTKTVSAVATIQALGDRNLGVDARIHTYLPAAWTRGAGIDTITFRELLTHTSGLRSDNGNAVAYQDLRALVARGIKLSDKTPLYVNQNFALLRVLIPYLTGFSEAGDPDKEDLATCNAYLAFVNKRIFQPCGIATIQAKPDAVEPTLCYPFPAGSQHGTDWGDSTRITGGTGLNLSVDDLTTFLVHLCERGTLLTPGQLQTMRGGLLGWQGRDDVRHGTVLSHGGFLWMPTSAGNAELNSMIFSFSAGVQGAVIVNSDIAAGVDAYGAVLDAYNTSWKAV